MAFDRARWSLGLVNKTYGIASSARSTERHRMEKRIKKSGRWREFDV